MKPAFLGKLLLAPAISLRRFPLGFVASVIAAAAAILLHHNYEFKFGDAAEGRLLRLLLLWPFALFGNVAWRLKCEYQAWRAGPGLGVLGGLLVLGWFLLPKWPENIVDGFWIAYAFAVAALLCATVAVMARRDGVPALWDAAWALVLAAFMATLAAMLIAGGINAAYFSIEKLFGAKISFNIFFDSIWVGFYLIGPLTAFAWLPHPFSAPPPQPAWIRGAARIILMPLCALYACILLAYIVKIALAMKWPDGWVAMPTLVFTAIGMGAYLIARPARDSSGERWAIWFCRLFPAILLPLSLVLLQAVRIRVLEYGFTEWRAAGIFMGGWILAFAVGYSLRPRLSPWWIAASLAVLLGVAAVGPCSLNNLSIRSQRDRLERILESHGVWARDPGAPPLALEGKEGAQLRATVKYLVTTHGLTGLPPRVEDRVKEWRKQNPGGTDVSPGYRNFRAENDVLAALGVSIADDQAQYRLAIQCDNSPLPIGHWSKVSIATRYETESRPFKITEDLELMAGDQKIATNEVKVFLASLDEAVRQTNSGQIVLSPEKMAVEFMFENRRYQVLFTSLNRTDYRGHASDSRYQLYGQNYLIFEE